MRLHVRGTVLPGGEERDLFVTDDRRLTFRSDEDARTVLDGGFLIPGLADAHCHLGLYSPAGDDATDDDRARASARAELEAGVLALREPGAPNRASTGLGPGDGLPRTFTAGGGVGAPRGSVPRVAPGGGGGGALGGGPRGVSPPRRSRSRASSFARRRRRCEPPTTRAYGSWPEPTRGWFRMEWSPPRSVCSTSPESPPRRP